MKPDPGDLIDPKTGEIIEVGQIKAKGITGTGVIALIEKAPKIGLIPYSTGKIAQIGNTSLAVAREILLSEERLWELQDIASQIIGTHIMFATAPSARSA